MSPPVTMCYIADGSGPCLQLAAVLPSTNETAGDVPTGVPPDLIPRTAFIATDTALELMASLGVYLREQGVS